jgi:hypothetical protein
MSRLQSFDNAAHVLTELISFHEHLAEFYASLAPDTHNALRQNAAGVSRQPREKADANTLGKIRGQCPSQDTKNLDTGSLSRKTLMRFSEN